MRFEELALAVGSRLHITIIGQDYKRHQFSASLMGYQKSKRLMIELIDKPPQVLLHEGLKVEGRVKTAFGIAEFNSEIDEISKGGQSYLILDYPAGIQYTCFREHARVPVDAAVEVVGNTALGMATSAMHGYLLDISISGARMLVEKELTKMVTSIKLGVFLSIPGLERDLTLQAKVCKVSTRSEEYPDYPFAYGIKFLELNEIDRYFLQAYCYQLQLQARQLLCE